MFCRECGAQLREGGKFCPNCGIEQEIPNLVNNPQKEETYKKSEKVNNDKFSNVETENNSGNKTTEELDSINKKIDDFIENLEKSNKEKPFIENVKYIMEVVYNNYRNAHITEITETFKNICDKSEINCKIIDYKNDKKNLYYKLNIVFDNDKKYYVDSKWGFIVEDLETLKQIYRGEINNPRTNTKIGDKEIDITIENTNIDNPNSKDTRFMTIVVLSIVVVIVILVIIGRFLKN